METLKAFSGRLLSFSPDDCCCEDTLFDGSCIAAEKGENIVIAKCNSILNMTHANCTWAMKESEGQPVECRIDTCENRGDQLIDYRIFLVLGIVMFLVAPFFGLYRVAKGRKKDATEKSVETTLRRLVYAYTFFQPSGSTRLFADFGTTVFILGIVMRFYETSFWAIYIVVAVPSTATIIILTLKYYYLKMVKQELLESNKDTLVALMAPGEEPLTNSPTTEQTSSIDLDKATREAMAMTSLSGFVETAEAVDVFQNFTTPFPRMFLTCVAQVSLLVIYIHTVTNDEKPDFAGTESYLYYLLGATIQVVYNKTKGRERYQYDQFWLECGLRFKDYFDRLDGTSFSEIKLSFHLFLRMLLSFGIDLVVRDFIILLLPLHLAQSDASMDFVLSAVAVYFISDLDNLDESHPVEDWKEEFKNLQQSYGGTLEDISGIRSQRHIMNANDDNSDEEDAINPPEDNEEERDDKKKSDEPLLEQIE